MQRRLNFRRIPGGHSLVGSVYIQHPIGEHISAELGYARLNQSYNGIQCGYECAGLRPGVLHHFLPVHETARKITMAENFEEQNSEQVDVRRYFDLARRRHMYFLIPLLVGWCAVWGASWVLPAKL